MLKSFLHQGRKATYVFVLIINFWNEEPIFFFKIFLQVVQIIWNVKKNQKKNQIFALTPGSGSAWRFLPRSGTGKKMRIRNTACSSKQGCRLAFIHSCLHLIFTFCNCNSNYILSLYWRVRRASCLQHCRRPTHRFLERMSSSTEKR